MNTQKVEERPKDLSILARDEEKKDTHRSILREEEKEEEEEREAEREKERRSQLHFYFFCLCLFQESHLGVVRSPLLAY